MPNNTPQQNDWSCALACIVSLANDHGLNITQQSLTSQFIGHFPEWQRRPGVLSRMEVLRLLELLDFPTQFVLITRDRQEFLVAFHQHHATLSGCFVILHHPTHHALRVLSLNATDVQTMDPTVNAPAPVWVPWASFDNRDPEYVSFGT
jgi:ABC-type bacteriocin/lantibiotic exporter with double-glycine peptidase domain